MKLFLETFVSLSPLYVYILIGVFLRKRKTIEREFLPKMNQLSFRVFLPILIFCNIYAADFDFGESIGSITYSVIAFVVLFFALMIVVPRFVKDGGIAATAVQGMFRSNFSLLGIIYVRQLFGTDHIGEATILVAIISPLFNVLAVLCFSFLTGKSQKPSTMILKIVTNPLIVATVAAFVVRGIGFRMPAMILNPLSAIADAATPFAMVTIGASLTLAGMKKSSRLLVGVSVVKLIVAPIVFVAGAALFGFRGVTLVAILAAFGGPGAISSAAMADQLGGDGELAGEIIAVTTLFSLPTMYLFVVLLRALGLC